MIKWLTSTAPLPRGFKLLFVGSMLTIFGVSIVHKRGICIEIESSSKSFIACEEFSIRQREHWEGKGTPEEL